MWIEVRNRQHRAYWRTPEGSRTYEPFRCRADAECFIDLAREIGVDAARDHVSQPNGAPTGASLFDDEAVAGNPSIAATRGTAVEPIEPTQGAVWRNGPVGAPGVGFRWLAEAFLTAATDGAQPETVRGYRRDINNHMVPFFGDHDIATIVARPLPVRPGDTWPYPTIQAWRSYLTTTPRRSPTGRLIEGTRLAPKTQRNLQALLAQTFAFAVDYDPLPLLNRNPCHAFTLTRPPQVEPLWLDRAQVSKLLNHLDRKWAALVVFLVGTGIRWGEAAALQVKDVELDEAGRPRRVYIHKTWKRTAPQHWERGRTKTPASRRRLTLTTSLSGVVAEAIEGRHPDDPLFTMPGGGVLHHGNFCGRVLRPAVQRATSAAELDATERGHQAPFPAITPHAFRHTHAALLISANRPLLEVQRRLGHADPMTTQRLYGHLTADVGETTLALLDRWTAQLILDEPDAVITAEQDASIDRPDDADRSLPLLEAEEDDELEPPQTAAA